MDTVKLHAAKTNLSKLVKRAESGEEIVIARGDKPVAKLVPFATSDTAVERARLRGYGAWKGKLPFPDSFFFDPLPEDELALWYGEDKK
jgi:prevent-host-death family protein